MPIRCKIKDYYINDCYVEREDDTITIYHNIAALANDNRIPDDIKNYKYSYYICISYINDIFAYQDVYVELCDFVYGEEIMVSMDNEDWYKNIFITKKENALHPYICVVSSEIHLFKNNQKFRTTDWAYAKKLRKFEPIKVNMHSEINAIVNDNGVELHVGSTSMYPISHNNFKQVYAAIIKAEEFNILKNK
jgi:hypothetical protein